MLALGTAEEENRRELAREVVVFAGLEFQLEGDAGCIAQLARAAASAGTAEASTLGPKFPVSCRLRLQPWVESKPPGGPLPDGEPCAPARPGRGPARLRWSWDEQSGAPGGELHTRYGHARLGTDGARRFSGQAWLASDALAGHFLLSGLAALLLHRSGGAILHAASVLFEGGVLAFVGPSGAGKSTACRHVEPARAFSIDRLAVLPAESESEAPDHGMQAAAPPAAGGVAPPLWLAHPLPGGAAPVPDMPLAAPSWRPLHGVLRVHRAEQHAQLEASAAAGAVVLLRESAFQAGTGPGAERELLEALERLARAAPVGRAYLKLGASLAPLLRRWLVDQARKTE